MTNTTNIGVEFGLSQLITENELREALIAKNINVTDIKIAKGSSGTMGMDPSGISG